MEGGDQKAVTECTRKLSFSSSSAPEPFTMKVMKLPAPSFALSCPVLVEHLPASDQYSLSNQLRLSSSLDPVYVGETFRTCVSLSHNSRLAITNVGVKIDMQKIEGAQAKHRVTILETNERELFPFFVGETKDYVISHTLTEPGENCLVCCITYPEETPSGTQRKTFKKFFRFQVFEPFLIKSHVSHKEEFSFIELNLTCAIPRPIVVESVRLKGVHEVTFEDFNEFFCCYDVDGTDDQKLASETKNNRTNVGTTPGKNFFGNNFADRTTDRTVRAAENSSNALFGTIMKGADSRSYIWRCEFSKGADKLGCLSDVDLEICWRSLSGETGVLRTKVDSKRVKDQMKQKDFDLILLEAPGSVRLEQPFSITLLVRSFTSKPLELRLQLLKEKMVTILPCGLSNRSLVLEAKTSKSVTVDLLPLGLGVHRINGFRLSCPKTGTSMDFDALHEVEVVMEN